MNWLLYAILGAILAGVSPVFAKSGMRKSSAYLAAALRGTFIFLSALFMVNLTGTEQNLTKLGQQTLLYLIFSGIVTAIVWICLLRALQLGEVIKVVPIVEGTTALNLLVGIFLFEQALNWNKIAILIAFVVGILMMCTKGSTRGQRTGVWIGYAIGAMALTTVTVIFERIGYSGVNTYYERLVRYGVALIVVWVVTVATKGYKGLRAMSFLDGLYLCFSGAAIGGAWYCFYKAYALGINASVELVEKFDLVAAVVLGCVFLRERLSIRAIFGLILMMTGFWLLLADLPVIPL